MRDPYGRSGTGAAAALLGRRVATATMRKLMRRSVMPRTEMAPRSPLSLPLPAGLVLGGQPLNLRQVVQVMAGERFQLLPQRDDAALRVDSGPLEVVLGGAAKQPELRSPQDTQSLEGLCQWLFLAGPACRPLLLIERDEGGTLLERDPAGPAAHDHFRVRQVADDLLDRPLARRRGLGELPRRESANQRDDPGRDGGRDRDWIATAQELGVGVHGSLLSLWLAHHREPILRQEREPRKPSLVGSARWLSGGAQAGGHAKPAMGRRGEEGSVACFRGKSRSWRNSPTARSEKTRLVRSSYRCRYRFLVLGGNHWAASRVMELARPGGLVPA